VELFEELTRGQHRWAATRDRPETAMAGDLLVGQAQSALDSLNTFMPQLEARQARVLAVSNRLVERSAWVEAALAKLDSATVAEGRNLLVPNQPPLWRRDLANQIRNELPHVGDEILAFNRSTRAYAQRETHAFAAQALLAVILMVVLHRFSIRARQRLASAEVGSSQAARLLERPYAIALLLALLTSPALHPLAPQRLMQMLGVIALFPTARIMIHAIERANGTAFAGLFVLLFFDRLRLALAPLPTLARAAFRLTLLIALGLAYWFGRRLRRSGGAPWLQQAVHLVMFGVGLALVAEIGGWTDLAGLLGRAILGGILVGLYLYAAILALEALLAYAMASPALRRSRLIDRHKVVLQRRLQRGARWLGAALWLNLVLRAIGLRATAGEALATLLGTTISVGALSLSLGGVLAFGLTILAAMLLARIVTDVLELEVYPRTTLPRGVPYALSTLIRYGVYSFGFILALAAAGVQLGQLAILLGGLGIGIGLGLQDLVKNFAAGLTLLFERRVQVGDSVQIPNQTIFGRVIAIGMRATVVRNFNGVEVVLPNSDLISGSVTNWTMSDRLHRIEVAVGVAYGSDPHRVVALLLDVARSQSQILAEPPPQALFKGFGDNSLDFVLRAWTDDDYELRTSDLALTLHRSLTEAGIAIPFPQRDLHLASVSPEARAALAELERKG
jgi:small-conductance mechanosensitive channel